jgi:hypothetical protein
MISIATNHYITPSSSTQKKHWLNLLHIFWGVPRYRNIFDTYLKPQATGQIQIFDGQKPWKIIMNSHETRIKIPMISTWFSYVFHISPRSIPPVPPRAAAHP